MRACSVIIPAYNQLGLLQQALQSVLQQEGVAFEVIITDDSTGNDIETYIQALDDNRILYHRHSLGQSAADNWNHGLSHASGDYIILMHHDEAMADANYLNRICQRMAEGYDIIVSQVRVKIDGKLREKHFPAWLKRYVLRHPVCLFLFNVIGPCACLAFRRELQQPFDPRLRWFVDVDWYYRQLKEQEKVCYDDSLWIESTHGHEGQITQRIDIMKASLDDKVVLHQKYVKRSVRCMLWLYQNLILRTKKYLGKI